MLYVLLLQLLVLRRQRVLLDHSGLLRLMLLRLILHQPGMLVLLQIRGRLHTNRLLLVLLHLAGTDQLLLVHVRGLILIVDLLIVGLWLLELYHDRSAVRRDGQGLLAGQQRQRRVIAQRRQGRHVEHVVRRLLRRRGALQAVRRHHGRHQGRCGLDERRLLLLELELERLLLLLWRDDLVLGMRRVQLVLELVADERLVGLLVAG